jgi:hypothetical protein
MRSWSILILIFGGRLRSPVESPAYAYRPWQKASPPGQYLPFLAPFTDALQRLAWFVFSWLGYPPPPPDSGSRWWQFLGARMIVADVSYMLILGLFLWLSGLFILFLLRALLRNEWAAAIAMVLLVTATAAGSRFDPVAIVGILIFSSLAAFVMLRFACWRWWLMSLSSIFCRTFR